MRARLPFVCANPDLVVDVGEKRYLCAGSIAAEYERRGGTCSGPASRTRPPTMRHCSAPGELRGAEPERSRILAIGDAMRTDLAAAQGMGIDALFIASGIHNDECWRTARSTRTSSRPCSRPGRRPPSPP